MAGATIHVDGQQVADKHLEADHGYIVMAVVEGDCKAMRLEWQGQDWWLVPANPAYPP